VGDPGGGLIGPGGGDDLGELASPGGGEQAVSDPDGYAYWRYIATDVGNLDRGDVNGLAWSGSCREISVTDAQGTRTFDFESVLGVNACADDFAPTTASTAEAPEAWVGTNFNLGFFSNGTFELVPDRVIHAVDELVVMPVGAPFDTILLGGANAGIPGGQRLAMHVDGDWVIDGQEEFFRTSSVWDLAVQGTRAPIAWMSMTGQLIGARVDVGGVPVLTEVAFHTDDTFGGDNIIDVVANPRVEDVAYATTQGDAGVQLITLRGAEWSIQNLQPTLFEYVDSEGMALDAQGRLWFGAFREGDPHGALHVLDPASGTLDPPELQPLLDEVAHLRPTSFSIDRANRLWMYGLDDEDSSRTGILHTASLDAPLANPMAVASGAGVGDDGATTTDTPATDTDPPMTDTQVAGDCETLQRFCEAECDESVLSICTTVVEAGVDDQCRTVRDAYASSLCAADTVDPGGDTVDTACEDLQTRCSQPCSMAGGDSNLNILGSGACEVALLDTMQDASLCSEVDARIDEACIDPACQQLADVCVLQCDEVLFESCIADVAQGSSACEELLPQYQTVCGAQ
jgi:hypothetical protein